MPRDIPTVGQDVPDFEVATADGKIFRLHEALKSGRSIKLVFYRGHW